MLKGKGKKAKNKLDAIDKAMKKVINKLNIVFNHLQKITNSKDEKKKRSMLKNMTEEIPKRIEFSYNGLRFYIDFTIVASEIADQIDIKGSIIYGTKRTLCFLDCLFTDIDCQRTGRCDHYEDKPLIQFAVNQHGQIKSSGEIDDEWWIVDKANDNLEELHYRSLAYIWKDALDWTNENLLP